MKNITNSNLVFKLNEEINVDQVLEKITNKLVEFGYASNKEAVLNGFKARELESTTGLSDGIAIPHVSSSFVSETKIVVVKLEKKVDWKALDGKLTDFVIAIAVPDTGRNEHFELLTKISSKLANPTFVSKFKKSTNEEIINILNNLDSEIKESSTEQNTESILGGANSSSENSKKLKVVGVTTCITGIAHTFIAAQALEDEGKRRGWDIHIERQGQMTREILTQEQIDAADYVIFGISKDIDGKERFDGKKTYTVEVAEPVTQPGKCLDEMIEHATIQNPQGGGSSTVQSTGSKKGAKPTIMSHMMAGISFMIPYIAMAGITLGLTTAFGYRVFEEGSPNYAGATGFAPTSPFANALNTLAGVGFTLYIPILGIFIANSIAGRKAMAPAGILALVLNTAPEAIADNVDTITNADGFAPFFNYQTDGFWGWEHSPALGFLGAIAAGYMVGYGVKYFTKYTDKINSVPFQAIVPLLIIPLIFTIVPWFFMAFIGYVPLYGISIGLNKLVTILIDNDILWIAGGIMGMMICFDLGGPVNKIAMTIGVLMIGQAMEDPTLDVGVVNGICAVGVSIPPAVLFFSSIGHRFTPLKMDKEDIAAGYTASLMGFFGITEGSIPFAAKDPKKWMPSFMFAGLVGGILASFVGVVDFVPMWGGPIIYIAGGYGSILSDTWQQSNWTLTLLYFIPLVVAGLSGFFMASLLEWIYSSKERKVSMKEQNSNDEEEASLDENKNLVEFRKNNTLQVNKLKFNYYVQNRT
ncbi:MAG: PTS fructose transporter subunit IIC [Candidatus Tyloplasma litorale]|nr:MAG: PTS fructose transporter subunit IIC [Mycoplasmatales bacterium]